MSYQPNPFQPISFDASSRLRIGQLTTLGDLKTLNYDNPLISETIGTGLSAFNTNKISLSVNSGQYEIRKSKHYFPYFSGKSQVIEQTFDTFQTQSNVLKRVGYFSSNAIAPYDSDKDGFWLQDGGTTESNKRIIVSKKGTETYNQPASAWNGDPYAATWLTTTAKVSSFTVLLWDFLWLGGAVLRLFVKTDRGFTLANTFSYPGSTKDTMIVSPNQTCRYEIRSTTGFGELRPICSQISTEGSVNESGKQLSVSNGVGAAAVDLVTLATIGTTYPILAVRKGVAYRDNILQLVGASGFVTSVNDQLLITIQINPTLSAPLSYTAVSNSSLERAVGNGTITVNSPGTILYSAYVAQNTVLPANLLVDDFLSFVGMTIDNVSDEYVLCGTPVTASVITGGILNFKEY